MMHNSQQQNFLYTFDRNNTILCSLLYYLNATMLFLAIAVTAISKIKICTIYKCFTANSHCHNLAKLI